MSADLPSGDISTDIECLTRIAESHGWVTRRGETLAVTTPGGVWPQLEARRGSIECQFGVFGASLWSVGGPVALTKSGPGLGECWGQDYDRAATWLGSSRPALAWWLLTHEPGGLLRHLVAVLRRTRAADRASSCAEGAGAR